jgi:hypothetical protein
MDGACLGDALHENRTRLLARQLVAQPLHQRIQSVIGNVRMRSPGGFAESYGENKKSR